MRLVIGLALCAGATRAYAQEISLAQTLSLIEANARAIKETDLPIEAVWGQAYAIRAQVGLLPALTPNAGEAVQAAEVRLKEHAAHLVDRALAQERGAVDDEADAVLDALGDLRTALGLAQ